MLRALKDFFASAASPAVTTPPEGRESALRLAAAVLLFEVVRADGEVDDAERTVMRSAVQGTFDLDAEESAELLHLAEQESRSAVSLFEFTSQVDAAFSEEHKKRLVELLWLVAFADGIKQPIEEHMVRKIAGLLHVTHPDFIAAKIRARDRHAG